MINNQHHTSTHPWLPARGALVGAALGLTLSLGYLVIAVALIYLGPLSEGLVDPTSGALTIATEFAIGTALGGLIGGVLPAMTLGAVAGLLIGLLLRWSSRAPWTSRRTWLAGTVVTGALGVLSAVVLAALTDPELLWTIPGILLYTLPLLIFVGSGGPFAVWLHPQLQRRFSVGLDSGEACVGRGVMEQVWHGRETVTFARTFSFPGGRERHWDATMIHSPARGCIVDYLGTHQHLASDLHFSAEPDGSLLIRSGEHRFREGPVDLRVPDLIGGEAEVRESFDDATGRFRISVRVVNRWFGALFGYHGMFDAEFVPVVEAPGRLRPVREEARV